jgi:RNA 3'-terminal phosphate cyclase (ATP)
MLHCVSSMLDIDGSEGEGGGQVLRTCLSLSALTGRPFRINNIRAGRSKSGLRPQHLTTVRAVAAVCAAETRGATIESQTLTFVPQSRPYGGTFHFDVADATSGGSAGSVTLILQALLWPLLFTSETAVITLRGGTHVPFSPPYHFVSQVFQPALSRLGVTFSLDLKAWGWYPRGQGEIVATIKPQPSLQCPDLSAEAIQTVSGLAAVTNLPSHIPQRMAQRASNLLGEAGLRSAITPIRKLSVAPGAGIFLWVPLAGFSSLGRPGLAAEKVAEAAVADCLAFIENRSAVGPYLADQLLLPLALAQGQSSFTTSRLTSHALTNAQLLRRWLDVGIDISGAPGGPGQITVSGTAFTPSES